MDKKQFIREIFIQKTGTLQSDASGKWGKMNGQQMIEHVTAFFKISSGKLQFPVVTPVEELPKYKAFILSDKPFRENTKAPAEILGTEPLPLRTANMGEAVSELKKSISEFEDYFSAEPDRVTSHPVFGELNADEWVLLHYKHVIHHMTQFDLV